MALLQHDVYLIHRACQEAAREHVIDAPTCDHGRYFAIAGDLWQKHVNHCLAVALLLSQGLFESAMVVGRAAYETAITLVYLMQVGDKIRNAHVFEAHMVVDTADVYKDVPETRGQAERAIAAIPADIMSEVRMNRKNRRPWSGKTIAEMAESIAVTGHRAAYAIMSWEAHARAAGRGIEKQPSGDGTMWRFGSSAKARDFEALANHMRRMLHALYQSVTQDFYGVTPKLATTNPHESNRLASQET